MSALEITPPTGFEQYLGLESLPPIIETTDLLENLHTRALESREAQDLASHLETLYHIRLADAGSSERHLILMRDTDGKQSMLVVCQDAHPPKDGVIGGLGLYETPAGQTPLHYALEHTKFLNIVMRRKTWMAGLSGGGAKGTIPAESDWLSSAYLQIATGFAFSRYGAFPKTWTGTDAGQTPDTIANMAKGSLIGGDHQICGTVEVAALDTPGSARLSLEASYDAIYVASRQETEFFGTEAIIPDLARATVQVEGFGRIGRTAARLWLTRGANIVVTDPYLTDEDEKLPPANTPEKIAEREATRTFIKAKFAALQASLGADGANRIRFARTDQLVDQKAQIFSPCSSAEGQLDEAKLDRLAQSGVRVILAGANGIFPKDQVWQLARRAHQLGIIVLPEILANCGSVTAAWNEQKLRELMTEDPTMTPERFVEEVIKPHITKNTGEKLALLIAIAKKEHVDLYTAGEIAFRQAFGLPYQIVDGVLTE